MSLKAAIDADLKQALLSGDKPKVTALRSLKAIILDSEVSTGTRETGLPDTEIEKLLQKEIKKRKESLEIYTSNNRPELAEIEQNEINILEVYLPKQLSETELSQIIDQVVVGLGEVSIKDMGRVIGAVKAKTGSSADGAMIANLVKTKLS